MASNTKIWLHVIISIHNKLPLILPENEGRIYKIVTDCFTNQNCKIENLNGSSEHIHFKLLIDSSKSVDEIINSALHESVQLINQELFKAGAFQWNPDYSAFSISESQLAKVSEYIDNQKLLHKQKSFQKELDEFHKLHGLI